MTSAQYSSDLYGTAHVIPFSALRKILTPKFPGEANHESLVQI